MTAAKGIVPKDIVEAIYGVIHKAQKINHLAFLRDIAPDTNEVDVAEKICDALAEHFEAREYSSKIDTNTKTHQQQPIKKPKKKVKVKAPTEKGSIEELRRERDFFKSLNRAEYVDICAKRIRGPNNDGSHPSKDRKSSFFMYEKPSGAMWAVPQCGSANQEVSYFSICAKLALEKTRKEIKWVKAGSPNQMVLF